MAKKTGLGKGLDALFAENTLLQNDEEEKKEELKDGEEIVRKIKVIEIEPNINVNKVIGIIGPNASGKSSIIHSLLELRIFLAQYQIVETAKEKKDEKMLKYMSNRFLPERNLENLNEDSEITLEMYIPNGEIPGYYTYSLIYNNDRLNEKLFYRKKYKSKKQQLIEDFNTDTKRSDIGYKCFYKDSIIKDYETVGKQLVFQQFHNLL